MRSTLLAAALAFAALIAGPAPAFADADPRPSPKLQSPADQLPRPTDEALRTAMTALRDTVDARLRADAAQPMGDADYLALAAEIDRQLAAITAGRDFHSRAGRHLQWTLGDIGDGAGLMRTAPRVAGKRLGVLRVVETLNFYGREYDHPGWVALKP
ncbi:MAG: hypothetical protein ACLGH1_05100 [Gammaproteobacteria bacterium]